MQVVGCLAWLCTVFFFFFYVFCNGLLDFCNVLLLVSLDLFYVRIMYETYQNKSHFLNSYVFFEIL